MATKKLVAKLLSEWLTFSPRKMNKEEAEVLGRNYLSAFKLYQDSEIEQAADDYAQSGEYYPPRPAQILSLVKNMEQSRHDRELVERWTCPKCHKKVSAICSEGICLDCAGFPPAPVYNWPPLPEAQPRNYKMEGRMKCQQCGKVETCIKDPADTGQWLCRRCYSHMSDDEISANMDKRLEWVNRQPGED